MIGIEFVKDKVSIAPAPAFHRAVHQAALRRGVLAITQWGKWVYRLQPALNMPPELFRWSCRAIADAIAEVAADPPAEPASILDREAPVEGGPAAAERRDYVFISWIVLPPSTTID